MSGAPISSNVRTCCVQLNRDADVVAFMKRACKYYADLSPKQLTERRIQFTGEKTTIDGMILAETHAISWHTFASTTPENVRKMTKKFVVSALGLLTFIGITLWAVHHLAAERKL
jgi:hypothetical protein